MVSGIQGKGAQELAKNRPRPAIRIPERARKALAEASSGGHKAYLYGASVLDAMFGVPMDRIHVLSNGPAPSGCRLLPLDGSPEETLSDQPLPALMLYCKADGVLRDPGGALPALGRRSVVPTGHLDDLPDRPDRAMAMLAAASRYGLRIGPGTARRLKESGYPAETAPEVREWLRLFLSGGRVASLMEEHDEFFMALIPELAPCRDLYCSSLRHTYDVYGHMARAAQACRLDSHACRMALLLHDIGKPTAMERTPFGVRFRQHAMLGRDAADRVLSRMGYPTLFRYQVLDLILYHDQPVTPDPASLATWTRRLGPDGIAKLMEVKLADIVSHNEQTGQRLLRQWEEVRRYLCAQGIDIKPCRERGLTI